MPDNSRSSGPGEVILIDGHEHLVSELSFSDLRVRFWTGRAIHHSGDKASKPSGYRHGVMTKLGDIDLPTWEALIRDLIHRSGEDELLSALTEWAADTPWLHSKHEIERYALELHASRIFDDPAWVCYSAFNRKYRPELLRGEEDVHESGKEIP